MGPRSGLRLRRGVRATVCSVLRVVLGWLVWQQVPHSIPMRYFRISDLIVEGNSRVPAAAIIESLSLAPDASILEIDLRALAAGVLRSAWSKTAGVSRLLPATLQEH